MKAAVWKDYSVIATGDGYKLERWGKVILLRPDPQVRILLPTHPRKPALQILAQRMAADRTETVFFCDVFNVNDR